ncbi:GNAT family N-acetyltransferase [Staphylococcus arlettae]|uniref:Acetoin utilization protein n=1 Tax=Staphylococcus arlettae TaxID=29378 RepID=A0A380CCI0_9STAP|nr:MULTISPECIES: GNAT family N-acetyltransferase [Staphylococcus]MCD8838391.1 GNAT family N-acetyltransferase [Staphylococcus arlettae]MCD8840326.1 GNAT family N-acetyltransferase [Staphylococcus arlettae]MCD8865436.1 GNAT family N-acetyltransferase [Staphylococcus arlettae]MCE4985521.1 GNAT family N-acetyltransferase [Staphylococcus arlettae]MEB5897517.1 GNAT family N-acetyltransferase [Staphylococcus arlettae]
MEHKKTYISKQYSIDDVEYIIEGPVSKAQLDLMSFDQGLTAFRYPDEQFEAIKEICTLDEGRIFILKQQSHIIGYVTFHYPDPLERWSTGELEYLIELGAIEISLPYRKLHLGKELIQTSLASDEIEDYIILTTEYYWHWDLKNSGLDVYEYKKLMQKLMGYGNLEIFATDDPEITSHPANCLMARIGSRITIDQLQAFDDIRFMNRFFF